MRSKTLSKRNQKQKPVDQGYQLMKDGYPLIRIEKTAHKRNINGPTLQVVDGAQIIAQTHSEDVSELVLLSLLLRRIVKKEVRSALKLLRPRVNEAFNFPEYF